VLKTFSGRRASQNEVELRGFIGLLRDRGVTRYCEIGARHGDTFHEIAINLPVGSTVVAVDLPGGLWGTVKSRDALQAVIADLCAKGYKASCLFGDSQTPATQRLVQGRGPYDAMLIDGDHTLAGVTRDWDNYRDMAPLIAFHDIVGTGQAEKVSGNRVEVPMLWASLKGRYPSHEFIASGSTMGIGVLEIE
jgi:hypothetical protein